MKKFLNDLFNGDGGQILAFVCILVWVMAAIAFPIALRYYGENFFAVIALLADIVNIPALAVYLRIVLGKDKPGDEK